MTRVSRSSRGGRATSQRSFLSYNAAGQLAFPDAEQQFLELRETLGSEHRAPFAFDVAEDVVDLRVYGASALGEADNARAALAGRIRPDEIAETLEAPEEPSRQ